MGSTTNYFRNKVLDAMVGNPGSLDAPATMQLALYSTPNSKAAPGTELVGNGYARKVLNNDLTQWPASVDGIKSNGLEILFVVATGDWLTVVSWALWDAIGTSRLLWGDVSPNVLVLNGYVFRFPVGMLRITQDKD